MNYLFAVHNFQPNITYDWPMPILSATQNQSPTTRKIWQGHSFVYNFTCLISTI
jgi:hypothetical protein